MKKLALLLLLIALTAIAQAQSIFKPLPDDLFKAKDRALNLSEGTTTGLWQWRFDATVALYEYTYIKSTKEFAAQSFSAIGPAIGYQYFTNHNGTAFNLWGVSGAVLLGKSIYNPDLAAIKLAVIGNFFQYFKAGVTFTPNATDHWGIVLGGGITFK